jgi:hypothetical protein
MIRLLRVAPYLFLTASLIAIVQLLFRGESGHYLIFSESAKILWSGKNPYGILYPSAYYLYSPFCGLSFFSLFAFFPHSVGLTLYMLVSLALFYGGYRALARVFRLEPNAAAIFLLLIFSEMLGSILNTRLEIALVGLLMLAVAKMLERPSHAGLWAAVLGFVANWKFLTLPATLLWLFAYSFKTRSPRAALGFFSALAVSFAFPLLIFSPAELRTLHSDWQTSMMKFMLGGENNWLGFQHLYQSVRYFTGYSMTYGQSQIVSLIAAGIFFALLLRRLFRKDSLPDLASYSLKAGVAFSCLFSPLSQSAAYVLYAPLLFFYLKDNEKSLRRPASFIPLGISFTAISLSYSDLFPKALRQEVQRFSLKALGVGLLFLASLRSRTIARRRGRPGRTRLG